MCGSSGVRRSPTSGGGATGQRTAGAHGPRFPGRTPAGLTHRDPRVCGRCGLPHQVSPHDRPIAARRASSGVDMGVAVVAVVGLPAAHHPVNVAGWASPPDGAGTSACRAVRWSPPSACCRSWPSRRGCCWMVDVAQPRDTPLRDRPQKLPAAAVTLARTLTSGVFAGRAPSAASLHTAHQPQGSEPALTDADVAAVAGWDPITGGWALRSAQPPERRRRARSQHRAGAATRRTRWVGGPRP